MLRADLISAFMLLTRLPVARLARLGGRPDLARCVWAFPVVGLVVNGVGGVAYGAMRSAGVPTLLAAAWTLAVMVLLTGGLHEDGLADTADGFGGGATRARKLEIMRDSRIGSFGALALVLSVTLRATAIAALGKPSLVITGMVLAGVVGRGGMILLLLLLAPAREDGMAASFGTPPMAAACLGFGLTVAVAFALLPAGLATVTVGTGLAVGFALARLAGAQVGGHTGDVLGAAEVGIECAVLTVLATALSR